MEADSINNLFSTKLSNNEIAFLFFGNNALLIRFSDFIYGIDLADLISDEEIGNIKHLDILLFTSSNPNFFHLETTLKIYEQSATIIIGNEEVYKSLSNYLPSINLLKLLPKRGLKYKSIRLLALKGNSANVYLLRHNKVLIFHGGGSGYINLGKYKLDLAFLPIGEPSESASMDTAIRIARETASKYVVTVCGKPEEFVKFKEIARKELKNCKIIIPDVRKAIKVSIH